MSTFTSNVPATKASAATIRSVLASLVKAGRRAQAATAAATHPGHVRATVPDLAASTAYMAWRN